MSRISIDVTAEQHKHLKAVAALAGKSLKDYILTKTLHSDEDQAMAELKVLLKARAEQATNSQFSNKSVADIAADIYKELDV